MTVGRGQSHAGEGERVLGSPIVTVGVGLVSARGQNRRNQAGPCQLPLRALRGGLRWDGGQNNKTDAKQCKGLCVNNQNIFCVV